MKGRKRFVKLLSVIIAIGMIVALVTDSLPVQVMRNAQTVDKQIALGADGDENGKITGWQSRVRSYGSKFGRRLNIKDEEKWLFYDSNNVFNNLYCIQSGDSHSNEYTMYDLYNISSEMKTKYFGTDENYHHFLWILENMYLISMSDGDEKSAMEDELFKKLQDDNGELRAAYDNMVGELAGFYNQMKGTYLSVDENNNAIYSPVWKSGNGSIASRQINNEPYTINQRDNFMKFMQNYFLLAYSKQGNGSFGLSIFKNDTELKDIFEYYSSTQGWKGINSQSAPNTMKFTTALLGYLKNGFNDDEYDINKYRSYFTEARIHTFIHDDLASFDNSNMQIGPFTLNNPYGFELSGNLKYGDTVITAYELVDEDGHTIGSVDAEGKFILSEKAESKIFFVKINDGTGIVNNAEVALSFNWKYNFGEVPTLTLFVPTGNDTDQPQVIINVKRERDSQQGNWTQTVDVLADIALKKYIVKVNDTELTESRLGTIVLDRLNDDDPATPHDAEYNMNKTPYVVRVGDTVTYTIQLFNEGDIDGTASKIVDHLPNYLDFKTAYYYDGDNKVTLITEKIGAADIEISNPQAVMNAYVKNMEVAQFISNSQKIYVECEVKTPEDNQVIYTNIAEITEYKLARGIDIDSEPSNWQGETNLSDRSSNEWINYAGKQSATIDQSTWTTDNAFHEFLGYEDDDDFEKVIIEKMDVALTKRFTRVVTLNEQNEITSGENLVTKNDANEDVNKDKCVISNYDKAKAGQAMDLTYTMNKKEALVQRGNKLETILTVYNEGKIDAIVKQVTDYLPSGLDLDLAATQKANEGSGYTFSSSDASNGEPKKVEIQLNGEDGKVLKKITDASLGADECDYIEIKLILTVSNSANGTLYNSAAITEYGFNDNNNVYRSASSKGIDIDSESITVGSYVRMVHQTFDMSLRLLESDRTNVNRPSDLEQDDDDYDCVEVEGYKAIFDLSLRKYISGVTKKYNENEAAKVEIPENRVPTLTVAGIINRLGDGHTADYYHKKVKVFVEKGDLVTYKMRVYNEGVNTTTRKDYRGRATQITDYLPAGLEFVKIEDSYDLANGGEWERDASNTETDKVVLNYVGNKILSTNSLEDIVSASLTGTDDSNYYQEVGIVCRVTADASEIAANDIDGIKVLTNRAAITGHVIYAAETDDVVTEDADGPIVDRDSQPEAISSENLDLANWYRNNVNDETSNPQEYYPGVQDDDDFETVYIKGYTIELNKVDDDGTALSGAQFSVEKWRNPSNDATISDISSAFGGIEEHGTVTYVANGATSSTEVDYYVIKEISVPEGYYNPLEGKYIKFSVSAANNGYVASDIEIYGGDNVADSDYTNDTLIDKNSTDGSALYASVQLSNDERNSKITITVTNQEITGGFKMNLVKTVKGEQDPSDSTKQKPLQGAKFNITIKDVTDPDNKITIYQNTQELVTNAQGKIPEITGLSIEEANHIYEITIQETSTPSGYIGLGTTVTFKAKSVEVNGQYVLDTTYNTQVSNEYVIPTIKADEIVVEVENRVEPVIHKGVKTVENQDSGYDVNEPQTWVITTTVPNEIDEYVRYIVTDVIDEKVTVAAEKRIAFINEDNPGENVKVEYVDGETVTNVPSSCYRVEFDKTIKQLKIVFINVTTDSGNFVGGQELTKGSTVRITYQTRFRVDDNGNIIGINQAIPNQAAITFNGNGSEEKIKKSETPEVHTGGFGIFKYDAITRKALQGAHFKITREKTEADKAVAAILAGDEETLSTVKFVKVKDEDGNDTSEDVEIVTGIDGRGKVEGLEFGEDAVGKVELSDYVPQDDDEPQNSRVYQYNWEEAETTYYVVEVVTPDGYLPLAEAKAVVVKYDNYDELDLTEYYKIANNGKEYDLALRKFITHVKGENYDEEITSRIPVVTLSDEFKDPDNYDVTTAKYEHPKDAVLVQQGDIVTYTIRVYNEGPEDACAAVVRDDIPDGVEFVPYTKGDGSVNDTYGWKMIDANGYETSDKTKAKAIVTEYLSLENGSDKNSDGVNDNIIKGFDSSTMTELDYRDLKIQFKVTEDNKSDRELINHAQIARMTNSEEEVVTDRDSTPNYWIDGEDDQDIEVIKLTYFDLALRKWVTKAIVIQDGKETVFETGHKAEDNPEDVVKVDLKKSKLNKVVVKFEYQIRITNEGKLGGWCDEITDHIPDGLTFDQEDNPMWTVVDDKTITTDALKGVYLEHGESAEVTVVLRWINSADNLGLKVNIAEISKDRNPYGTHDIDSTPGNYVWGEDDIDDAPVMLAVKTGNEVIGYVTLAVIVIGILAAGVTAIRKIER